MSFQNLYKQVCDFQEQVISPTQNLPRSIRAPYVWPASLHTTSLPVFVNDFGTYQRRFLSGGIYEYRGTLTMTLYSYIAGEAEGVSEQFDTVNHINTAVSKLEAYPFLEISGTGLASLTEQLQIVTVRPTIPNLRYSGNGSQLFWGGSLTVSLAIEVPKDC